MTILLFRSLGASFSFSLSVNEKVCVCVFTCTGAQNARQNVKFTRQRSHTTENEKQRRKQGLTVISARLPSGCPCYSLAATCGRHRWDWAFPHGSHKQRTHCLVSVFSHFLFLLFTFLSLDSRLSSLFPLSFSSIFSHFNCALKCGSSLLTRDSVEPTGKAPAWHLSATCDGPKLSGITGGALRESIR